MIYKKINNNLELQARWSKCKQWGREGGYMSFENLDQKTNIENKLSFHLKKFKKVSVSSNNQEK